MIFETVQIEIGLLEYGGNKKAVQTEGLLTKHQNWENTKTICFHHNTLMRGVGVKNGKKCELWQRLYQQPI